MDKLLRFAAAAAVGLFAALVLWFVWPQPPPPLEKAPSRKKVVVKLDEPRPPRPTVGRVGVQPAEGPPPRQKAAVKKTTPNEVNKLIKPWDPEGDLIGQVDDLLTQPYEPAPHLDDPQVAANRGYWRRNEDLKKVEARLLKRIEQDVSPYETFEARVALAQVYRSQAEVMGKGRPSDLWNEPRARKWQNTLDAYVATAEDKATMVLDMLQNEASNWPEDDPAVRRLAELR